jgi:hypothetical protein
MSDFGFEARFEQTYLYIKRKKIPKKVCFYFFENLQNFQKNKNKPLFPVAACTIKRWNRKSGFYTILCFKVRTKNAAFDVSQARHF